MVDVMLSIWAESVAPVCYSSLSWYPNPDAINNAGTWVILRAVMALATAVSAVFFSISDIFSSIPHILGSISANFFSAHGLCADW